MIETSRLILRKFNLADVEGYFRLNANPEVARYTGQPPMQSMQDARRVLRDAPLRDYRTRGYGRLACIEKGSGELIGFAGLKYLPELDEVDIGYRFLPDRWGMGYATESAKAVMDHGRTVLGFSRIIGIVDPVNVASVHVLEKLGMRFEKKITYGDEGEAFDLYA